MQAVTDLSIFDRDRIAENSLWNVDEHKQLWLHRIHAYPAKFPPFLVRKLIGYFEERDRSVQLVADPFCGCGTSALESVILGKDFWGCDINPVATLIAKAKSRSYRPAYLNKLHESIMRRAATIVTKAPKEYSENDRLRYWFDVDTIHKLYKVLFSIQESVPTGKYRDFFLTGFSNILKPCSRWLTKSIKPQVDPSKTPADPYAAFNKQIQIMVKAVQQAQELVEFRTNVTIVNRNFLNIQVDNSFADLVITSPPYVTSYEYADLHQLSAIWLGYTDDYRNLRKGSIGSEHNSTEIDKIYEFVNQVGRSTYDKLRKLDISRAKSVLNYFYDLDLAVKKIKQIVNPKGSIALVIGDTSYKGVPIKNAKYLAQSLIHNNFSNIRVSRRKISSKILTPYRNNLGQFTSQSQGKQVYSHEYILTAEL